ncbi:MAG TPA: hypothetical protein VK919_13315 [Solirubrobacterales bacterium]|nr:hypothetical protein [Solirubrobacterales bacterium]
MIELVRFEVAPQRQEDLVAGHLDARRAIRDAAPPGALWSRLLQHGERAWIEIVGWESRGAFIRALEAAPSDPTAGAWFTLADPGWTILTGEIAATKGKAPPREGELELLWEDGSAGGVTRPGASWSARIEIDDRAWIDPTGWVTRRPMVLMLTASRAGAGRTGGDSTSPASAATAKAPVRELARIAHAVDSVDERGTNA